MTRVGLWRDRRAAAGMMVAGAMPLLLAMAAFAVDFGTVELDGRRLQGVADAAALAAAGDPANAEGAARAIVAANWRDATLQRATRGRYATAATPVAQRFAADASGDAAQVEVAAESPTFFAAMFGQNSVRLVRRATAQRRQVTSFAIGSRLASVDVPLLNAILGALVGGNVSLNLLDYQSMDGSKVDVFTLLDRLRIRAGVSAGDYDSLLAASVSTADVLGALSDTLTVTGDTAAAAAVRRIAAVAPSRPVRLSALIDAGPYARQAGGAAGVARVPALAFVTALLETDGARQVALDLGAGVPGLASFKLSLAIGERAQQSPWLAVTAAGDAIVRTAQARLYARTRLQPTMLPGLASLVSVDLPLFVQLAGGEARLRAIDCASTPRAVTLEAKVDALDAVVGTVDETKLADFSTVLTPARAKLIDTPLIDVSGSSKVSLGAAEPWQTLRYPQAAIDAGTAQTIRSTTMTQGIAASLVGQMSFTVSVLGLPIPLDPLLRGLGATLGLVAPAIDAQLTTVLRALGIGLGEADVSVTGLRCGGAVLVA